MDPLALLANPAIVNISAAGILAVVVLMVLTEKLVPARALKRAEEAGNLRAMEWKKVAEDKDILINAQQDQITRLLAGIRIADHFYSDFVTPIDENTHPRQGVTDVGT